MKTIPAIDLYNNKCVRLEKGEFKKMTTYSSDPLEQAKQFEDAGLKHLHLVDLQGAEAGKPIHLKTLEKIASNTLLSIDYGGGLRTPDTASMAIDAGAQKVNIGTMLFSSLETIRKLLWKINPEKIIASLDVLDNQVKISGWKQNTYTPVELAIKDLLKKGIQCFSVTDIASDGTLSGTSTDLFVNLRTLFPNIEIVAGGGISSLNELEVLDALGIDAAIVGKAIYENRISAQQLAAFMKKTIPNPYLR